MYDLIVKNGQLVTPDRIYPATIAVKEGKFAGFLAPDIEIQAKEVVDAKGHWFIRVLSIATLT